MGHSRQREMSSRSPAVSKKTNGRLNGRAEPEVTEDGLDLSVIDRVQDYLRKISEMTSKVPGHHLHVNQQLHDDGSGVCGEYHQGSPGQDQGAVPTDQHRPRAAHQGYRGAHQGGQEGSRSS